MGNIIVGFAVSHKEFIIGAIAGYSLSHLRQATAFVFDSAMKVPAIRAFVVKNAEAEKKAIDEISDELKKQIDEEAAKAPVDPAKPA